MTEREYEVINHFMQINGAMVTLAETHDMYDPMLVGLHELALVGVESRYEHEHSVFWCRNEACRWVAMAIMCVNFGPESLPR